MITRRNVLKFLGRSLVAGAALGGYAFGIEPLLRLSITRYQPRPKAWPPDFPLKIAAVADVHAVVPGMTLGRIRQIVDATNALEADIIVLLGDYVAGMRFRTGTIEAAEWSAVLKDFSAPLGVHAILGNHDWWSDHGAQQRGKGPVVARSALEAVGIPVYENDVVRLEKAGRPFWLAGLADQLALIQGQGQYLGTDDLKGTLAKITDDAPAILLAHEPDIFPEVPDRIALTLSGHTHGGQIRILGYAPLVPSRFGNRFGYGHIIENDRHLIVSGGLGCSILPVRLGMPPEIVVVELGSA